ncbi:MAG: alkaline phosphatase family protein [Sphingopyxis sp.]
MAFAQQQSLPTPQPMEPVREAEAVRPAPPKLIIAISVDQFSADLFTEYRALFRGGLARLAGGVVFPQGYQAHGATETCPGHSTILTGSLPARTGIIANNWYDLSLTREDRRVYCSEDPSIEGTSSASGRYAPSINYLRVPTLGDLMKAADPRTRVVSVAGKDRAAIMMGGRSADELWWLSASGLSSYRGREASPQVARISAAVVAAVAQPRAALDLPQQCAARSHAVDIGDGRNVGTGRLERAGGNFRGFMASPEADGAVLAAGASLAAVHHLGRGEQTDLLILGLSATDYVGHSYGTEGAEMCLQMLALDRELGDFFTRMDASGVDYAVVLTADHGGHDLPERNQHHAMPSATRVDRSLDASALSTRLKAELGMTLDGPLLYGDAPFGDYYLSRSLSPADRTRVLSAVTRIIAAHPQVDRVVLGSALAAMPIPRGNPEQWSVEQRLRASYMAGRSGDFLVVLKARVTPIPEVGVGYVATHGSVWDYDRRVPMLFWRAGMRSFEQPNPVMTVDILPTLAGLIGLPIEARNLDGRCLDLVAGSGTSCPAP